MQRDLAAAQDMLDAAQDAMSFVEGFDLASFGRDMRTQFAVAYRILVVGEAANRTTPEFRERYSELPWSDARAMRNVIVHEYDKVLVSLLWETIHVSLPPLIEQLERLLHENQ